MNNLTAIILLLASAGIFFGYIHPAYQKAGGSAWSEKSVKALIADRDEYAEALEKTREIELTRTGLLEKYNAIAAEDRERLVKLLPDHIDSVRLILDINTIAAQYGMTLRNITLAETDAVPSGTIGPAGERYGAVGVKFTVSGSYAEFRSFLRDLEQSLRLVDIASVAFKAREEDPYDYSVTVSTYRLK